MLKKLMKVVQKYYNGITYKALFLTAYFGFFRLAPLLPSSIGLFDKTRYPIVEDVIWSKPGAHIIITCAKNMQKSGQHQVVQLPELSNPLICPVLALRKMLKEIKSKNGQPLFQINTKKGLFP